MTALATKKYKLSLRKQQKSNGFTIYIPKGSLSSDELYDFCICLCDIAGGYTMTEGKGGYKDPKTNEIITEDVYIFSVISTGEESLQKTIAELYKVEQLMKQNGESSVLITRNMVKVLPTFGDYNESC